MNNNLQNAEDIFNQVLGIPDATARRACLDRACAGDAALRQEVESLLQAHEQADGFMRVTVPPLLTEKAGDRIGRYKLLEQIGEGGFGVVWMAEQEEPVRRRVALKIIKLGMDTREVVARFEAERQALAMMDHPNIATVFDGGATDTGRPYFVMELVKGIPITQFCDERKLTTGKRLDLFMQVCQAVQHAHQKGIIHRDLKPTNVLVTVRDDRPVPKVIDFGVAKATQARLTEKTVFTRFHHWIGTPAYMSPEQAGLGSLDVDTRSDVYSLGVLLYELLTGRPPFDTQKLLEKGYDAVMKTIREEEPPKPSTRLSTLAKEELSTVAAKRSAEPAKLNRLVHGDLDWIVMKALEKDRRRRYETPNALARDVEHFLNTEPVSAAAPTVRYELVKWLQRHRTAAGVAAAFALMLALTAAVSTSMAIYAHRQKVRAEQAEEVTKDNLYAADMGLAKQALADSQLSHALELLSAYIPRPGQIDRRGIEWRYLWMQCRGNQLGNIPFIGDSHINGLCLTPDNRYLVVASESGRLSIIQFEDFRTIFETNAFNSGGCATLAMSPDGSLVAASGLGSRLVRIWKLSPEGQLSLFRQIPAYSPYGLAFSPDNLMLAVGMGASFWTGDLSEGGITEIFSVETGNQVAVLPESGGRLVAYSPDGKWIATGPWRGWYLKIWNAQNRELTQTIRMRGPLWARFSPNSQLLMAGSIFQEIVCYNPLGRETTTTAPPQSEGQHGWVLDGSFDPSGRTVAVCVGKQILLENLQTRARTELAGGHAAEVRALAFSSDGEFLVSGDADGRVILWGVHYRGNHTVARDRASEFKSMPIPPTSPRGEQIAYRSGNQIDIINGKTGRVGPILPTPAYPLGFPDEHTLLAMRGLGFIEAFNRLIPQWNMTNQTPVLETWDLVTMTNRSVTLVINQAKEVTAVALSPGSERIALAWRPGERTNGVTVLAVPSGDTRFSVSGFDSRIHALAFSPDGSQIAMTTLDGKVRLLKPPSESPVLTLQSDSEMVDFPAFSPDGRQLAVSGSKGVRIWSLPEGRELAAFLGHVIHIRHVRYSADGRTLIGYGWLRTVFWHVPTMREMFTLRESEPRHLIPLAGEHYVSVARIVDGNSASGFWDVRELPPLDHPEEWLNARPSTLEEARRVICPVPQRNPKTPSSLVALDAYYSSTLDRNWHGGMADNDLAPLPQEIQVLGSIAFDVRGLVLPDKTGRNAIRIERSCHRLHFLHNATGRGIKAGDSVGRYVIHYADGQAVELPLVAGKNIQDWWADPAALAADGGAQVAWVGSNTASSRSDRSIHLVHFTWENPRPSVPVSTVEFLQVNPIVQPFLVAMTAE